MMNRALFAALAAACLAGSAVVCAAPPATPSATRAAVLTEAAKIEALIAAVEAQPRATFIRNGREHAAPQAAAHLRMKWGRAGSRVKSARDFITHIASKSSLTGRKYRIRFADGREVDAAEFFEAELRRIEATPPASR
jgi:hypothetical protein